MVAKKNYHILLLISLPLMVAMELVLAARFVMPPRRRPVIQEIEGITLLSEAEVAASAIDRKPGYVGDPVKQPPPVLPNAIDFSQIETPEFDEFADEENAVRSNSASNSSENALRGGESKWDVKWPARKAVTPPSKVVAALPNGNNKLELAPNGLRLNQETLNQETAEPQLDRAAAEQPLVGTETRALLQRWCDAQGSEVFPIEKELAQRGFGRVSKALAQRYLSDDAEQRQRLVDEVVKRPDIDARPWLLLLADDADADVRLASVTVLATSRDPALIEKAWQVAIRDRDPRIAGLASRLRDRRNGTVQR